MEEQLEEKLVYRYSFGADGPIPIVETALLFKDDILLFFRYHEVLAEGPIKTEAPKEEGAEGTVETTTSAQESPKDEKVNKTLSERGFGIKYFNPVLNKMQTISSKTQTVITDVMKNPVDDALSKESEQPVYSYVTSLIITEKVNPYLLEEIRRSFDIQPPKPFGGGMVIPLTIEKKEETPEEIEIQIAKGILTETLRRKESVQIKAHGEIVAIEHAVQAIRKGEPLEKATEKLPVGVRAALWVRLKKKEIDKEAVLALLMKDLKLLKGITVKLKKMSLKDLIKLAHSLKGLREK